MHVPEMDIPERMVRSYFGGLRLLCSSAAVLADMPVDMESYYIKSYEEAVRVYKHNKAMYAACEDARA